MIDAEVFRLRRLRRVALLTRGLARRLEASFPNESVFSHSAVTAWSIARLINGRLNSHPNLDYQRGQAKTQTLIDHWLAAMTSCVAVKQGRARRVFAQQLQILAREVDDTQALTWSADLGDALGRTRWQLLRSLQEFSTGARTNSEIEIAACTQSPDAASTSSSDWPYLAL